MMPEQEKNKVVELAGQVFNDEITEEEFELEILKIEGGGQFFATLIFGGSPPVN
jgi:hypothetical protein